MLHKLSPDLHRHAEAAQASQTAQAKQAPSEPGPVERGGSASLPQRIDLLVEFTGNIEDLKAVGFQPDTLITHPNKGYTIAAGMAPTTGWSCRTRCRWRRWRRSRGSR